MDNKILGNIKKYFTVYLIVLLVVVSFAGGMILGRRTAAPGTGQVKNIPTDTSVKPSFLYKDVDFKLFDEAWQLLKTKYIDRDKVLDSEMFYGALSGMVASLGDPHSAFYDPKTTADFSAELQGDFEGIGAELGVKKNQLTVISALPKTPADKAGLKSGDKILAIDGVDAATMTLDEAVSKIRGQKGTTVTLSVFHDGWDKAKDIKIIRDQIHVDSIHWSLRKDNIYYVEIVSFNQDTMDLFDRAIRDIIVKNPKGIIIDLRNDPGGYLDQAVSISSEWVDKGPVVLEQQDGTKRPYETTGKARLKDFKTVVLVNKGSASAAEILAGALQDYGKATIVGEQTFGKGSVQQLLPLSDGSSVKLTIARWLTPQGRSIDKEGITPDVAVELSLDNYNNGQDPQLDKAVEILSK